MRKLPTLLFAVLFLVPLLGYSAVMQSSNYRVQSDSVNFAGNGSGSASYSIQDTLGEIATGNSSSTSYNLGAGYQSMQSVYIAISDAPDIILPAVGGISGGSSIGSSTWTVTTDSPAGYTLSIETATTPALKAASSSISNYTPAGADPDYLFSIATTISAFGFTPEGTDINARFKDNGSVCNTGSGDTVDRCWAGLSTTPQVIAGSTTSNHPSGTVTSVKYRAEIGVDKIQDAGTYSATITATVVAL